MSPQYTDSRYTDRHWLTCNLQLLVRRADLYYMYVEQFKNNWSGTAFCIYEHALTLHREMESVWRRKISMVSLLFVVNRYSILCYSALSMIQVVSWSRYAHNPDVADEVSLFVTWPLAVKPELITYLY